MGRGGEKESVDAGDEERELDQLDAVDGLMSTGNEWPAGASGT